jgi:hypothetical protein
MDYTLYWDLRLILKKTGHLDSVLIRFAISLVSDSMSESNIFANSSPA